MTEENIQIYLAKKVSTQNIKHNTIRSYRAALKAWVSYSKGDDSKAEKYIQSMLKKMKHSTIINRLAILSDAYEVLEIGNNPFFYISRKLRHALGEHKRKHTKRLVLSKKKPLSTQEAYTLVSKGKSQVDMYLRLTGYKLFLESRNKLIYLLLCHFGLRISEIVAINIDDLDLRTMTLCKAHPPYPFRAIDVSHISQELETYLRLRGKYHQEEKSALFLSRGHKRLSDTSARRAMNKMVRSTGTYLKGKSIKLLRSLSKDLKVCSAPPTLSTLTRLFCRNVGEISRAYMKLYGASSDRG